MRPDTTGLKARFIAARGYWDAGSESLLALDPAFFAHAVRLAEAPIASGALSPKLCALLRLAFDASITHLDEAAVQQDIAHALQLGATSGEVLEVCHLAAVLGIHSCTVGVPMLAEELLALGRQDEMGPTQNDTRREALKQDFIRQRGYWSPLWDDLLRNSPDFFEAYTAYSSHPWSAGVLEPKVKEFVYIAIDAATHHLFEPGLRIHIRNALGYGASAAEIMTLLQLLSVEGLRSSSLGAQVLRTSQPSRE
jgi:alkylhydroperoxidase/carboxymuconolactone decarboxylase family protein YurZ